MDRVVKRFPGVSDPFLATSGPHSERQVCQHYQVSAAPLHDIHTHYPPFIGMSSAQTNSESRDSRECIGAVTPSGDMHRGLEIDFYQVGDHRLLASWASYFRDQCIQAQSALQTLQGSHDQILDQLRRRDADLFVKVIDEQGFLQSREVQDLFRKEPFTLGSSSVEGHPGELFAIDLDSQLATDCMEYIFDKVATMQDSLQVQQFLPFDTPEWKDCLWQKHGLKEIVSKERIKFSSFYAETIRQSVDACFPNQKTRKGQGQQLNVARDLRSAVQDGSEDEVARHKLMAIYGQVIKRLGDCTSHEVDTTASPKKRPSIDQHTLLEFLEGKHVDDLFSPSEESFVRMVIQKYLTRKFGSEIVYHPSKDCEMEELEDDPTVGLDRYNEKDVALLYAMCEKCKLQRAECQSDPLAIFNRANLEMMMFMSNNNEGSPGKRVRRRANTFEENEMEKALPSMATRA